MKILILGILIPILGSCASATPIPDIPCPVRPTLIALSEDLQSQMPTEAISIVAQNQLALKEYALKLEAHAGCN